MSIRRHLVLVPGFIGFDLLGSMGYYAGVSKALHQWRVARGAQADIHYFDNLPTASVSVRAERLRRYLAKRVLRGVFAQGDEVTLLGHSTGGLDIRRLLFDLNTDSGTFVDGEVLIPHSDIRAFIKQVVFLSVPHYGTGLADVVKGLQPSVQGIVRDAELAVELNHGLVSWLRRNLTGRIGLESDLLLAIRETLDESDERRSAPPAQQADQREARAELQLWLEHIGDDFHVIDDLRSRTPDLAGPADADRSPAHYDDEARDEELARWAKWNPDGALRVRSYASVVRTERDLPESFLARVAASPARHLVTGPNALANLLGEHPVLGPLFLTARGARLVGNSAAGAITWPLIQYGKLSIFELFYAACIAGHFHRSEVPVPAPKALLPDDADGGPLSDRDSDGVVNTLSMLWPPTSGHGVDHDLVLVNADHAAVIGHYRRFRHGSAQRHTAYNLLDSPAKDFRDGAFRTLWHDVFAVAFG